MKDKISLVVPCYNEEESFPILYKEFYKLANDMTYVDFEFIIVDDGSSDGLLNIVKGYCQKDDRLKYISFSKNFGKEAAIFAGLQNSTGQYIAIIDADLQDPPLRIKEMYHIIVDEGYDCVGWRRTSRKGEPPIRSFFANLFYTIINKISKTKIAYGARDFRLMTKQMVDAILSVSEYNRFTKGIFSWVGFKTKWLEYENVERRVGKTKWSFWKLCLYSIDGIIAFTTVPLALASVLGFIFFVISIIMICFIITKTILWGDPVSGWPSLICIIFFLSGIQLFCTGILGQYLSKTYLETKKRPIYIVKETDIDDKK